MAAFDSLRPLNLHECTRAYNAVMRACAKRGKWQLAQSYYDEMFEVCQRSMQLHLCGIVTC